MTTGRWDVRAALALRAADSPRARWPSWQALPQGCAQGPRQRPAAAFACLPFQTEVAKSGARGAALLARLPAAKQDAGWCCRVFLLQQKSEVQNSV